MKQLAFVIFFFLTEFVTAQTPNDIPVNTPNKESAEQVIYKLKDSLRRLQYECFLYKNFYSVDSSTFGGDSLVLNYKSKSGKLIKRNIQVQYTSDGFVYEKTEHYNNFEQPEFVEHWELARSSQDATDYFTWRIYSYDRFVYDPVGRIVTWIQYHPTYISRRRVRRTDYKYDLNGKQTSIRVMIPIEKFWD